MQINLIWAQARNGVIGKGGVMPWHVPEDLAHLRALTLGSPVIMGRKTWDSIPVRFRPLPGRTNIVLTRSSVWTQIGAQRSSDLGDALRFCEQLLPSPQVAWVIGGAQIYAQAIALATRVEVTLIDADFDGDTVAPVLNAQWHITARADAVSVTGLAYSFIRYERLAAA